MAVPPFGFSVHNFISSIGADAGFAAIIGLAILVLLYFVHARETANLREEAELLTQRLHQAEARVAQLSRFQPAAQDALPLQEEGGEGEAVLAPYAPAGTAAPALASATHVVALSEPEDEDVEAEQEDETAPAPVAAMAMVGAAAAATAPAPAPPAQPIAGLPAPPPTWPPAPLSSPLAPPESARTPGPESAPGAAEPAAPDDAPQSADAVPSSEGVQSDEAVQSSEEGAGPSLEREQGPPPVSPLPGAIPRPATDAGGNGAGHDVASPGRATGEPAWTGPISASRNSPGATRRPPPVRQLPPLESKRSRGRSRLGRGAVALVALAVVALAVVLVALTSASSTKHRPARSASNATTAARPVAAAAFNPSTVTVAVLNGTSTNQLAHRIGLKLAGRGYREGTVATAASQTASTTVVAYVKGTTSHATAINLTDATHVAQALGLHRSAVQPVDQSTLQIACPASASCTTNVVVTVGADLASQ